MCFFALLNQCCCFEEITFRSLFCHANLTTCYHHLCSINDYLFIYEAHGNTMQMALHYK